MKCPQCESPAEPEHEADRETNTGAGCYHCTVCGWSEPAPAPTWCLARIEHLESVVAAMRPVVHAAVAYGMSPGGCHRSEARLVEAAGLFVANAVGAKT